MMVASADLGGFSGHDLLVFLGIVAFLLHIFNQAKQAFGKKEIIPQPALVKKADEFVEKSSYNKHCEINRDEHGRIERELHHEIEKLSDRHHELAREVSDVTRLAETTEAQLLQINTKLENIWRALPKTARA